jgi:hypothetical protein
VGAELVGASRAAPAATSFVFFDFLSLLDFFEGFLSFDMARDWVLGWLNGASRGGW